MNYVATSLRDVPGMMMYVCIASHMITVIFSWNSARKMIRSTKQKGETTVETNHNHGLVQLVLLFFSWIWVKDVHQLMCGLVWSCLIHAQSCFGHASGNR